MFNGKELSTFFVAITTDVQFEVMRMFHLYMYKLTNNLLFYREWKIMSCWPENLRKKKNSKKQFYNNILINDSNLCYHLFLQNLNVH